MLGAIIGDIKGSSLEFFNKYKTLRETTFTDDTILTLATIYKILNPHVTYEEAYKSYYLKYPEKHHFFGKGFKAWAEGGTDVRSDSFGNGSAMRVAPIAYLYNDIEQVLEEAEKSAKCSHNHPEAIEGAKAIAAAIYLTRRGASKEQIKEEVELYTSYDLSRPYESLTASSTYCRDSVPNALICFLTANSFDEAIKLAIDLEGDTDTTASMAGAIAAARWGIPHESKRVIEIHLPEDELKLINDFNLIYKSSPEVLKK